MNLLSVAQVTSLLPFKRQEDSRLMMFDPDGTICYVDSGVRVQVTRTMLLCCDLEIVCPHPLASLQVFADRNTDHGFKYSCSLCTQNVRISKLETVPPGLPPDIAEMIKKSVHESVDRQF